jgi:hypothetical protein
MIKGGIGGLFVIIVLALPIAAAAAPNIPIA